MIAAHALPLSSRPAARTDLGELPCPSIPLRPRARPSRRCSTTNRLPARPCRVGPRNRPRRRRRSGHAPGIPPGRGPIDRDARCYRHRCGRPRCSPTPRCAGSWRSWTGVGRRRICIRCLPPDWPIRWYRLARRRRQADLSRPPCSGYACNRQVQANRPARWRFSAPTGADGARMHWPAASSPSPAPVSAEKARRGGSSPCTSADADRKRGEATRWGYRPLAGDGSAPSAERVRAQLLRGIFGSREPRPSRRAASRRSRRDVAPAGCRSRERCTCAEPSSSGPE